MSLKQWWHDMKMNNKSVRSMHDLYEVAEYRLTKMKLKIISQDSACEVHIPRINHLGKDRGVEQRTLQLTVQDGAGQCFDATVTCLGSENISITHQKQTSSVHRQLKNNI